MKYCSNCGSSNLEFKIPVDDNRKRYCCNDCGTIFYTNPNLVVGTLSTFDNKILIAKRSIHPRKDKWTLPAGFLENAETMQAGALRETLEETQAEAEIIKPYTVISLPHISQIHVFYLAKLLSGSFGPTNESSEVKLVEISEIPWDELAFPTVSMTLKYFVEDSEKDNFEFREEEILLS